MDGHNYEIEVKIIVKGLTNELEEQTTSYNVKINRTLKNLLKDLLTDENKNLTREKALTSFLNNFTEFMKINQKLIEHFK